jgi:hypothetical protein
MSMREAMKQDAVLANSEAEYMHCDCKIEIGTTRRDADVLHLNELKAQFRRFG